MIAEKDSERYSKLVVSYLVLLIGIIFLISRADVPGISFVDDFITPLAEFIALSQLWYIVGVALQFLIEQFWPLLLVYYGAKWVLDLSPGKA